MQSRAQETAGEVKRIAKEKAGDVRAEVRGRTQEMKEQVRGRVEEKKQVASDKVHALARALRAAGDTLENEGENRLARYGRQAADQVERLASYVDTNDTNGMMRQLEHIARDNPAAFTGSTFAAGLLLGRFLRSSRPDDTGERAEWDVRGTSYQSDDTATETSRGYDSGSYTETDRFGGSEDVGLGGARSTGYDAAAGAATASSETATPGASPSRTRADALRTPGREGVGGVNESGTGFETGGTKFGSGAGHATTGSGSTAGREPGSARTQEPEQDRTTQVDRTEGGTPNG